MSAVALQRLRWKDGLTASSDRMMWQLKLTTDRSKVTSGRINRGGLTQGPITEADVGAMSEIAEWTFDWRLT